MQRTNAKELKELESVHRKMDYLGAHVDKTTLDRALFPPAANSSLLHAGPVTKDFFSSGFV